MRQRYRRGRHLERKMLRRGTKLLRNRSLGSGWGFYMHEFIIMPHGAKHGLLQPTWALAPLGYKVGALSAGRDVMWDGGWRYIWQCLVLPSLTSQSGV